LEIRQDNIFEQTNMRIFSIYSSFHLIMDKIKWPYFNSVQVIINWSCCLNCVTLQNHEPAHFSQLYYLIRLQFSGMQHCVILYMWFILWFYQYLRQYGNK
jgi:hypothetical protein